MQFLCNKCRGGALQGSAHACKTCTLTTYSAYAYCVCCALEKDKCQSCEADMQSGRTEENVTEVTAARAAYLNEASATEAEFNASIADIKDEIDAWLKVNQEASGAYEAAIKPYQDSYQTAATALRTLQSTGAAADSEAVVAAQAAFDEANLALRQIADKESKAMWAPINEARAKIGEEKLKRHEDAWRAKDRQLRKAQRRLELVAERICGHLGVDAAYKEQLARLDEQFG